ncbi:MAG: PIN domain-containing protein [Actinomycetota bacterium]|nr:PIN domain-containing protein [Actinomycetota bacterium]
MRILVDTSVWSLALRRKKEPNSRAAALLKEYIEDGEYICIIGIILQEVLSGVTSGKLFNQLENHLAAFPLVAIEREDYVSAAQLRNDCKKKGVQVGTIDALIAAVCIKHGLLLLSVDKDFQLIANASGLNLIDLRD